MAGAPDVRWAVSPRDQRCHAFSLEQANGAGQRGYAEARCGNTIPGRLIVAETPSGAMCLQCATLVGSELPDPGSGGPPLPDDLGGWGGPP